MYSLNKVKHDVSDLEQESVASPLSLNCMAGLAYMYRPTAWVPTVDIGPRYWYRGYIRPIGGPIFTRPYCP